MDSWYTCVVEDDHYPPAGPAAEPKGGADEPGAGSDAAPEPPSAKQPQQFAIDDDDDLPVFVPHEIDTVVMDGAGAGAGGPPAPQPVLMPIMECGSPGRESYDYGSARQPEAPICEGAVAAGAATLPAPPADPEQDHVDMAAQVKERFQFLCPADQKVVCRRELHIAQKREAALVKQLQQTIDRYERALEVSRALSSDPASGDRGLSPYLTSKYEERIGFFSDTMQTLAAEKLVSLPEVTGVENAKGFIFSQYANVARFTKRLGESAVTSPYVGSANIAIASFAQQMNERRRTSSNGSD